MANKGVVLTVAGIAVPVLASLAAYAYQSQPRIEYVEKSIQFDGDGHSVLTFYNPSMLTPTAITQVDFTITDADELERIDRKDPRPKKRSMEATSANEVDNIFFHDGHWMRDGSYQFTIYVGYHIPTRAVNDLRIGVVNDLWAGDEWHGRLDVWHNGLTEPYTLNQVTIRPQRE